MSKFESSNDLRNGYTVLDNQFISEELPSAPAEYVKIYIAALSIAQSSSGEEFDSTRLGKLLQLDKDTILSAWEYWEGKERITLIPYMTDAGDSDFILRFNPPKQMEKTPVKPLSPAKRLAESYEDSGIRDMFDLIRSLMGRELNQNELLTFLDWVDNFHFPPDLVAMLVHDCIERGKNELGYMKKIASDWHKEGVNTLEKAEAQQLRHKEKWQKYSRVLGFFRINRQPTLAEERIMEKWFFEYNVEDEVVMKACEQTINISKWSLGYVDAVLQDWIKAGVKTSADLDAHLRKKEERNSAPAAPATSAQKPRTPYPQKNTTPNFSGRTYDTAALREKLVRKGRGEE